MIEIIFGTIAIIISMISLAFSIYTYKKTLPRLKFIFYSSRYHFPSLRKKLAEEKGQIDDFENSIFSMELLTINSGQKEISIVDIFPPIKQVSEIKIYRGDNTEPIYMLKRFSKEEMMKTDFDKKQHIPIINCERLKMELSFKLNSAGTNEQISETNQIWKDLHNKDFIFVTSDGKKYKVNASKILAEHP